MSNVELFQAFKDKKVLVTGATGFTGRYLVRRLDSLGANVHIIARPSSNLSVLDGSSYTVHEGQVYDSSTVEKACEGVHYILHVAAAYREAKLKHDDYKKVHVHSTKLLIESAKKNKDTFRRLVLISTIGVHGHIDKPPANEESPFKPGDDYQKTKLEAEELIQKDDNTIDYSIIRPAAIYGPEDNRLLKVFKLAKKPFFPKLGLSKGLYHLIHVEDLVSAILIATIHPKATKDVFICGNKMPIGLSQMVQTIASGFGKKIKTIYVPAWPFFILGFLCEMICIPLGIEPPIYRRRVAFFTKDRSFDTTKIHEQLGFNESFNNESGLQMTLDWYRDNHWL